MTSALTLADPIWDVVAEIALAVDPESWQLVGGLMIQAHCLNSQIYETRATRDIDMLLDVATQGIGFFGGALRDLGFFEADPTFGGPLHRFVREHVQVDILANAPARWLQRKVFRATGVSRAFSNGQFLTMKLADGTEFTVQVPSLPAALALKATAFGSDSRNPERHAFDAMTLLACGTATTEWLAAASKASRREIAALVSWAALPASGSTMQLTGSDAARARQQLARLRDMLTAD